LPWLAAQPEGTAQRPAYLPFDALGTPRCLGQLNGPSRKVALLGLRERLATPVIGKLSGLIWVHVIHLLPALGARLLDPDTATLEKRC
jgi:hypothetical protein